MDAWVQLARNALCCIKDLNIFPDTFLYDPAVTARYYAFPTPLDRTTPLEICIFVTQFYAFVTVSLAGIRLVTRSSIGKMKLLQRLVAGHTTSAKKEGKSSDGNDDKKKDSAKEKPDVKATEAAKAAARRIVASSLLSEGDAALRSVFIGINVLAIGIGFFWISANSLHITETDWIGGLPGLIGALVAMEVGLLPLLWYMLKDGAGFLRASRGMLELESELSDGAGGGKSRSLTIEGLSAERYGWLAPGGGWSPFWVDGSSGSVADVAAEGRLLVDEEAAIAAGLAALSREVGPEVLDRLHARSKKAHAEGMREYLYFIFNFVAFYGYLVSVLPFFFEDESIRPAHMETVMLWMRNVDAEWRGNFAGDLMWTIEPVVILCSPMLILAYAAKASTKKKSGKAKEKAA